MRNYENSNDVNWDQAIWQDINDAVVREVAKVRTAQKVFPTVIYDDEPTELQNHVISSDPETGEMSVKEGQTKPYVEIYQEFRLTSAQVSNEGQLELCKSLARMAAKMLALAEDAILFSGVKGVIPAAVKDDGSITNAENGLLGVADPLESGTLDDADITKGSVPIDVYRVEEATSGVIYGQKLFAAVVNGIAKLTAKGQAPPYALLLPTKVYADSYAPPGNQSLVTTAERIRPLLEGGFYGTGSLPSDTGLLVALAGDPIGLYLSREAKAEFIRKECAKHIFKVSERFQFVVRDARSLVALKCLNSL